MAQNIHFLSLSLLILGDFKVTCCMLVDITTSSSVLQLRLLQTRNSALSLESKYQQFYQTKNCASSPNLYMSVLSLNLILIKFAGIYMYGHKQNIFTNINWLLETSKFVGPILSPGINPLVLKVVIQQRGKNP